MLDRTRKGWTAACALGFGALFVGFALTGPVWSLLWPGEVGATGGVLSGRALVAASARPVPRM